MNISHKHSNLTFKVQKLRSSLCDVANKVIDTSSNMNEIEDMLLDKTYAGIEVINMIAFLDIIEILQNPMIDSIISNMYYGPFERETFIKQSTCFKIIEEIANDDPNSLPHVTRSFKIFDYNCSYRSLYKYYKINTKQIRKL